MKKGIIIAVALIIVLIVSFFLWHAHLNRLRSDMEYHIEAFYEHFEQAEVQSALDEAVEAKVLAERLRDNEALDAVSSYIEVSEAVIRGNAYFEDGQYEHARNTFSSALDDAIKIDNLNYNFIIELIAITDAYIRFFELIEQADNLLERDILNLALRVYEEALLVATTLSFEDGKELATISIQHVEELIFLARLAEAADLESQGTMYFLNGDYRESITLLRGALEIYYELGEILRVAAVQARIDLAEQRIEEQDRLETEELYNYGEQDAEYPPASSPDDEHERVISNYEHNRGIDFDLRTLIDNQNQPPASLVRMGTRPGLNEGWYNGCGWVAAYNSLIILGNPMHPAEIVHHFETTGGTVWDGVFGTFPHAIEGLFVELDYDVNHTLFPQITLNLDDTIRNSRVAILAYMHTSAAHYIVIEYRPEDGTFVVYNDSFARRRSATLGLDSNLHQGAVIDSVNALIRESPNILFTFSLITIN
ncbi:MAG: hypothetical protein FWD05_03530 [Oscillospiraceae bacterium]|nr:hypothetical protein [Oscillospiraceae bacterium]